MILPMKLSFLAVWLRELGSLVKGHFHNCAVELRLPSLIGFSYYNLHQ